MKETSSSSYLEAFPPVRTRPELPPECTLHIFSYLGLKDVLSYGSCNLACMKESLLDLRRRRRRMSQKFAYWRDWKETKADGEKKNSWNNNYIALWDDVESASCRNTMTTSVAGAAAAAGWIPFPSVQERVEQLFRRMPSSHGNFGIVHELRQELLHTSVTEDLIVQAPLTFNDIFSLHQAILRPLKLHAGILFSVIHSDPWAEVDGKENSNNNSTTSEDTSLEQYMGDVFALTFLMSFSDLGIVEGGPTNASFVKQLREPQPSSPSSRASQSYRSWVHLHSSILRVKTFTVEQQKRLGIPSQLCEVSEMIPNDCYLSENFMGSDMCLTFFEFGRLGLAFQRGRDDIQVRELPARCLFAFLITDNVHFHGVTTRLALDWLCLVHDQAQKARPMSVSPPAIRIRRPHV